ncbi:septum site-determining protein Ssd [Embleya sp. NBC_00896]|uniref:septum site-determining protein Ssd n=1 Tax=Embleya sp. NBC_00896 TaxID=2975961 RepID=UPI003869F66B|nr:CpaE-like family protein [Embleya sp. NBC_00896]
MAALSPPRPARPLLVTGDPALLDELLRLCAVAGIEPEVQPDAGAARGAWPGAPLVIVGDDVTRDSARCGIPRREDVILIGDDLDDGDVWRRAVEVGADHVVFLPDAEAWIVDRLGDVAEGTGPDAHTIAVIGGCGGSGASTLACALAVTAVRTGLVTALVDGDPLGGGLDVLLGGEDESGLRWPDLAGARGRIDGGALSEALPHLHGLTVLSWDRERPPGIPPDTMRSVVRAVRRRHDFAVLDVPRHTDPVGDEALRQCDTGLLVVPAEVRALAAAAQALERVRPALRDVRAVVRQPSPSGLSSAAVARGLGVPLAGELRPEAGLSAAAERGDPPGLRTRGPLARFCRDYIAGNPAGLVRGEAA